MRDRFADIRHLLIGSGSVGRYGLIGVSGVFVDFVLFLVLINAGLAPVLATVVSTLAGILNNYVWNSLLNFRASLSRSRGARFVTVGVLGLAASTILLQLFLLWGLDPVTAKWLTIPLVALAQFVANKFWTFRPVISSVE